MSELYLLFKVAAVEYAVAASDVLQTESFTGATRVPGVAEHVAGLVQIRGRVVPVIDLRMRFGLPAVPGSLDTRVVVVQRGERPVGLVVDSAREVLKVDPAAFRPPPELVTEQAGGFVEAVAQVNGRLIMLIDCDRIIGEEQLHGD